MTLSEVQSSITKYAIEKADTGSIAGESAHIVYSFRKGYDVVYSNTKPRDTVATISAFLLLMMRTGGGFTICKPE